MRTGAIGFAWLAAGAAAMVAGFGGAEIGGIPGEEAAAALIFAAFALALTDWAVDRSRGAGWQPALTALVLWTAATTFLGGAYLQRSALLDAARQWSEEAGLSSQTPAVSAGGDVTVIRRVDGTFPVPARINDQEVRFIFDTGASTVVLSAETAERLGYALDTLTFRVPVSTANGRALAAPVVIDRLSVGPIAATRVPALVVRPGLLAGNLLGQTFLDRLESYEVRGNRLVLRAPKA
jgi:aspartyl protease family protein